MSTLAPILQSFFTDRLCHQLRASIHTITAYRDAIKLLLAFASSKTGKTPSRLDIADLDAPLIGAFLTHLEGERANSARTRNARLAAIHSLFRLAALLRPEDAAVIQRVLAIPPKRFDRNIVTYLNETEIAALIAAPDPATWTGRRDRAMLTLACQAGLRASELIGLTVGDVHLGPGAHISCLGKGRKQRITPLTKETVMQMRTWLTERHPARSEDPLFPTRRGNPLSRDALERRLATHVVAATQASPSLRSKQVSPHVLRHSAAMRLLAGGVDTSVIALWLGHEDVATTKIYLHADLAIKERTLSRTAPIGVPPGRYKPSDDILGFLEGLYYADLSGRGSARNGVPLAHVGIIRRSA